MNPMAASRMRLAALSLVALMLAPIYDVARAQQGAEGDELSDMRPLQILKQGSLSAGANVLKDPGEDGGEFHYDYLYAFFQIPVEPRENSLVMWHGCLGSAWERRSDGRGRGYQSIFVNRSYPVYVIDQPRISRGARGLGAYSFPEITTGGDCGWNTFRYGLWLPPDKRTFFPGVQLAQDSVSTAKLCELSGSPGGPPILRFNVDPELAAIPVNAVSALIDKIGPTVLVTHSNSGQYGWHTRIKNDRVRGIVAYEPAAFVFPEDEPPAAVSTDDAQVAAITDPQLVPADQFDRLTKIPIQIVYGDNIEFNTPSPIFGVELWRVVTQRAQQFADAVNSRGGDVEIQYLPDVGLSGNTHFPFFDLNNQQVASLMAQFLHRKGLDKLDEDGRMPTPRVTAGVTSE
jgi:hypothetical protein